MFIFGESSPKFQKANGVLTRNKSKYHNWNTRECRKSTHVQNFDLQSTKRGNWEREGSLIPIFPPLNFKIVRMLTGWIRFCSKVSVMWAKCGWMIFELKKESYIKFGMLLMIGFLVVEEYFITHDTNLVSWLGMLLFREEFDMLLTWFG